MLPPPPREGQVVRVRSRQYLVEGVVPAPTRGDQTLVRLACLDDDAQGQPLDALWEKEVDAQILDESAWGSVGKRGFDPPKYFNAFLNTLRWNCVTSTDPKLFQAPYRAGIEVLAYQLEPLRKALRLPRVNLFIADDVGLGKTIEAGLIVRELLMRQKVRRIVVCCPASVVLQWKEELEQRFGLSFVVYDRDYMLEMRRERGYAVNAWTTHSRFILSHSLLRDEAHAAPLRDWLGSFQPGSLLILDEAHNAAPSSGAKYAIDSILTKVIRDLAPRFEHRLFLTATPHNGHSNSFAALLELLDPQRFCRGVPVKSNSKVLDDVMVRRLKNDLRAIEGGFTERKVVQEDIDGLPPDAPDLELMRLLGEYRDARATRLANESKTVQNAAALITTSLQKRLLSSIEAFARTLAVHKRAIDKAAAARATQFALLEAQPGNDDDRAELPEDEVAAEEDAQMEAATSASRSSAAADEGALLSRMTEIAERTRHALDPKVRRLVDWIRANLSDGKRWNDRRVLVFTEYTDTKRYLEQQLRAALGDLADIDSRIGTFHGGMNEAAREEIKRAFNADPDRHPLRILIATDAAREGVNLQNHCADLFHFDVPWNPGRMEQRNGRIDRKLQRAPEVRCHYFFYVQRPEDRVLQALVRKTDTILKELGSLTPVLDRRLQRLVSGGIKRTEADRLVREIGSDDDDTPSRALINEELEDTREQSVALRKQISQLQDMLADSKEALGFEQSAFRDALSCSLQIMGADPLQQASDGWSFPALDQRAGADPTWADTLDSLRPPRQRDEKPWDWRRRTPRPVVFADPGKLDADVVHLHLEHRVVQRLLGRFRAQGFVHDDLSRACLGQSADPQPRVVLLGRLSLYGAGAARLHDELLVVAARWTDADARKGPLKPYGAEGEAKAVDLLQQSLLTTQEGAVPEQVRSRLLAGLSRDMADLLPALESRASTLAERAAAKLEARGQKEATDMAALLTAQRQRIQQTLRKHEDAQMALTFDADEKRQLEADRKHQNKRLAELEQEQQTEPDRIRATYEIKAQRVEPVGIVYLWPVSG